MLTEETLGQRVRAARQEAGLTQDELARAIGVEQPTISRLEKGKDISSILLTKLASATQKTVDFFLRDEPLATIEVFLKIGQADGPGVRDAMQRMVDLVEDYEFLRSLDA